MLTHCLTNYKHVRQPLSAVFYSSIVFCRNEEKNIKVFCVGSCRTVLTGLVVVYLLYEQTKKPSKGHKGTKAEGSRTPSQASCVWRGASLEDTQRVSYRATVCSEPTSCSLFTLVSLALPKRWTETHCKQRQSRLLREIPFRSGQQAPG